MSLKNIYNVVIIHIDPPCKWTGWQDVDNPSGEGDFETPPDGCNIEHYEFQLVDGGTIYNNVSDVFWYLLHDDPYVYCRNVDQPLGSPPTGHPYECADWKVKYCCAQPKPKCFCCPPVDPINYCNDANNSCRNSFNGTGTCMDITNPDWEELDHHFDLSAPDVPGACQASDDISCCRCFKNKTCMDVIFFNVCKF